MSALEYAENAEIADPQSLQRRGKSRAYSLFGHLLMGQERFMNGKDG
jgi:hypothetical protein